MNRILLKSKLHRVRVTDTSVDYVGSIGIDEELMQAADIVPYEKVLIADIDNGNRLETYAIPEARGSGRITILGAAGRLVYKDDVIIVFAFGQYTPEEVAAHKPKIVFVDEHNRIDAGTKG